MASEVTQSTELVRASFGRRFAAKIVDASLVVAVVAPATWVGHNMLGPVALGLAVPVGILLLVAYTAITEHQTGCTLGKRIMGLRVVGESGRRITWRESLIRQLPLLTDTVGIDTVFALFTGHHQRVFELASRTRVVRATSVV